MNFNKHAIKIIKYVNHQLIESLPLENNNSDK